MLKDWAKLWNLEIVYGQAERNTFDFRSSSRITKKAYFPAGTVCVFISTLALTRLAVGVKTVFSRAITMKIITRLLALRADPHVLVELLVVDKLFAVLALCPEIIGDVAALFGDPDNSIFRLLRE